MSSLRERVVAAFRDRFAAEPQLVVRAPGRVNLLGGHVDYNEGWVLPGAVDRAVWVAAAPAPDELTRIVALDLEDEASFSLERLPRAKLPARPRHWHDYPAGVAWSLAHDGHETRNLRAVFASDVPIASGMSSSAAVEVAFLLAWEEISGLDLGEGARATIAQRAENRYVGVACGIMDQYASLHGRADHLLLLDCRTLEHELVPVPPETTLLVADSGVRRELAGSDFNSRREECGRALELLRGVRPEIRALRDVSSVDLESVELPAPLDRRARHVVEECARVRLGAEHLVRGRIAEFGRCIRLSHESSRDLYEVSTPELDLLADAAWEAEGCWGARLVGAGFGGCVAALVRTEAAERIARTLAGAFESEFARRPSVLQCRLDDGARIE